MKQKKEDQRETDKQSKIKKETPKPIIPIIQIIHEHRIISFD